MHTQFFKAFKDALYAGGGFTITARQIQITQSCTLNVDGLEISGSGDAYSISNTDRQEVVPDDLPDSTLLIQKHGSDYPLVYDGQTQVSPVITTEAHYYSIDFSGLDTSKTYTVTHA